MLDSLKAFYTTNKKAVLIVLGVLVAIVAYRKLKR